MLFATGVFSWGSFRKKPLEVSGQVSAPVLALIQGCIAVYGGYFGGGIGFLMLAALTVAGQQVRTASATKNALAMSMTATAFVVFAFSDHVHWLAALTLGAGATAGGLCGTYLQRWMPERILRAIVVLIGCALTVWMFVRPCASARLANPVNNTLDYPRYSRQFPTCQASVNVGYNAAVRIHDKRHDRYV
jgi:uncharacterized membrane protein YfcA